MDLTAVTERERPLPEFIAVPQLAAATKLSRRWDQELLHTELAALAEDNFKLELVGFDNAATGAIAGRARQNRATHVTPTRYRQRPGAGHGAGRSVGAIDG